MKEYDYNIEHFINKFTNIPDSEWNVGSFVDNNDRSCALGHCGHRVGQKIGSWEGMMLILLFWHNDLSVMSVNDGLNKLYKQKTPKERILAALKDIKASNRVTGF